MNDLKFIISEIVEEFKKPLDNSGVYYHIFYRQKSTDSITKKLQEKADKYKETGSKMQDIIGLRIVFYFMEDVEIINEYLCTHPLYRDSSDSRNDIDNANKQLSALTNLHDKIFMPSRLNLIFQMNDQHKKELISSLSEVREFDSSLIDCTYEVQLRTVLSEGWHEVEHDLRYKTRDEHWWKNCEAESRMLNGIYATLETSERALDHIFSIIAYKNYKEKEWGAMLRNHFRIHTMDQHLSTNLVNILSSNVELAKEIFRIDRRTIIKTLLNMENRFPLKIDNILFLSNRMLKVPSKEILEKEPIIIKKLLDKVIYSITRKIKNA